MKYFLRIFLIFVLSFLSTAVFAQSTNFGFAPVSTTQSMSVTSASSNITLNPSNGNSVLVQNSGANLAYVKCASTASTSDFPLQAGWGIVLSCPAGHTFAAITGTSTTTLLVSLGLGTTALTGGGSGGSGGAGTLVDCQAYTNPTTSTPVSSNNPTKVGCDVNGNLFLAPQQLITLGPASVANSLPYIASSQYPANGTTTTPTPLVAKGTGSTGAVTGTLTPAATATAYVCGFVVSYVGGTAQVGPLVLSGLLGGSFTFQIPLSTATGGNNFAQSFTPCIPASAVNTPIVMTTIADGTATAVDVNIWGYGL